MLVYVVLYRYYVCSQTEKLLLNNNIYTANESPSDKIYGNANESQIYYF